MARPVALKILQSTPTDPAYAGPDNRLCQKCGLWPEHGLMAEWEDIIPSPPTILFLGDTNEQDRQFLLSVCEKAKISRDTVVFRNYILCPTVGPSPLNLRCCRAFLLGQLATLRPAAVVALGDLGLAALLGNASKRVTHTLGRELDIPELPEQMAFATYHPEETRQLKRPARAIQKNLQIVRDIKKTQVEVIKRPIFIKSQGLLDKIGVLGFDTEFDEDGTYTLALSDEKGVVVYDTEENENLCQVAPDTILAAHYIQVDLDQLVRMDVSEESWLQGKNIYDTFVLAHIQNENLPQQYHYGVEDVLTRLYRAPDWKAETEVIDPAKPLSWGLEKRKKRCGYDAWASYKIWEHPSVQSLIEHSPFIVEWQHRMLPTYHRIQYTGVYVDQNRFDTMHEVTQKKEEGYAKALQPYIRDTYDWPEFELSNNGHIRSLLYKKMGMPILKKSQSGLPSVDADALENMLAEEIIPDLLEWRKANKLMTTWYGKEAKSNSIPLYKRVHWGEDRLGYLPVNLGVGSTSTLRRQSNAPNMQNWAKDTRPIVCTRFGEQGRLIWSDYEKLEVFLLADEIKCDKLKSYFLEKGGYLGLAKDLMGTTVEKGDDNYRAVKATALAANYNAKPMTIAGQLYYKAGVRFSHDYPELKWKSEHYFKSREILETYFHMFPKIPRWFNQVEEELLRCQGVRNRFGHFRHLPVPKGSQTPGYKHLLNQAINFKIQSVAGLVTGIAAVQIEEALIARYWKKYAAYHGYLYDMHRRLVKGESISWKEYPYLCNEVHDELMVDVPLDCIEHVKPIITQSMTVKTKQILQTQDPTFNPYLGIEQDMGTHWYEKEEQ